MFNIIIAVIAIALIAILTIASMYHGGSAFNDNKIIADAARYRTEATQISSAITLFKSDGNEITDKFVLQDLVDKKYLNALPAGWLPGSNKIIMPLDTSSDASEAVCITAIEQSGYNFDPADTKVDAYSKDPKKGIPHCDKPELDPMVPCCVNKTAEAG